MSGWAAGGQKRGPVDPPPQTSAVSRQGLGQDVDGGCGGMLPTPCTLQQHLPIHGLVQTQRRPGRKSLLQRTRTTTQTAGGSPEPRKPRMVREPQSTPSGTEMLPPGFSWQWHSLHPGLWPALTQPPPAPRKGQGEWDRAMARARCTRGKGADARRGGQRASLEQAPPLVQHSQDCGQQHPGGSRPEPESLGGPLSTLRLLLLKLGLSMQLRVA